MGRIVNNQNNLLANFPNIAKEWNFSKNEKRPEDYLCRSGYKAWWKCKKYPKHEWETEIHHRTGPTKSGCPYCSNKKVDDTNSLLINFPEIAKEFHPTKNGNKTSKDFVFGSNAKIWWQCSLNNNHEWKTAIFYRVAPYNQRCPYCINKKADNINSLFSKFPKIAKEFHPTKNGSKTSKDFVFGSNCKVWWVCSKNENHEWVSMIKSRTVDNKPNCPFCVNNKVCEDNNLLTKFPEIAKEFHPTKNGNKKAEDFVSGSHGKVWWQCKKNNTHEWLATIKDRTSHNKTGCPHCSTNISNPELKWLNSLNISKKCRHFSIILPNGKKYIADAYVKETNTVYEFNGDYWHGNPNKFKSSDINARNKKTFGELYINTIKKEAELKSFGYNVISIWESEFNEIYRDNNDNL